MNNSWGRIRSRGPVSSRGLGNARGLIRSRGPVMSWGPTMSWGRLVHVVSPYMGSSYLRPNSDYGFACKKRHRRFLFLRSGDSTRPPYGIIRQFPVSLCFTWSGLSRTHLSQIVPICSYSVPNFHSIQRDSGTHYLSLITSTF